MAVVVKWVKTIRNNWKKSVFFSAVAAYGVQYGKDKYDDGLIREAYCLKAKEYGDAPLRLGEKTRRVTVFLNPAAYSGKAKKLFDQNAAPLLYLAGLEVNVVKTEYEGQVKKYMEVLENTDAVVVAGGDGTLLEVVTGLLRREDEAKAAQIPVGIIPVGYTNTFGHRLFDKGKTDARWLLDSAMAIVENSTKPVNVMQIKGSEGKDTYAVSGLQWGAFRDAEERKRKYWYMGRLKHKFTYLRSSLKTWPPIIKAKLSYIFPCDGCSKCYIPPPVPVWRWWHIFIPPRIEVPKVDYSTVVNDECGQVHSHDISAMEFTTNLNGQDASKEDQTDLTVHIGPETLSQTEYIKEGWRRGKEGHTPKDSTSISVQQFKLSPDVLEGQESWFTIDSESFEVMPIEVTLLKNKIRVFCLQNSQPVAS